MRNEAAFVEWQLQRLRAMIPLGEDTRAFLARVVDDNIASAASDTPMGIVPPSVLSRTRILASARMAVELIEKPDQLADKPEGIVDLGVIEWLLRPALPLRHNLLDEVESGPWKHLATDEVKVQSSSVCRLDVSISDSDPIQIGTGFVAGEDGAGRFLVVTNAHVLEEVRRIGWPEKPGIAFCCDFERFEPGIDGTPSPLDEQHEIHPTYDLAILHLRRESLGNKSVAPLRISSCAPDSIPNLKIGVIGHPAFDSRRDPFPQFFGFGNEFGIKRFSPGFVRTTGESVWRGHQVWIFHHDATTLSGSSGSCIVDLNTMKVIGLHFGGWPLRKRAVRANGADVIAKLFESNGAVPLWALKRDPLAAAFRYE